MAEDLPVYRLQDGDEIILIWPGQRVQRRDGSWITYDEVRQLAESAQSPGAGYMFGAGGALPSIPSVLRCGLPGPPDGPTDVNEWYSQVQKLPETRITGWFGATIGSPADDGDVQLWLYDGEGNHLDPTVKLVIPASDLIRFYVALGRFVRERNLN